MKKKYTTPEISCVEIEDDLMNVFAASNGISGVDNTIDDPYNEFVENQNPDQGGIFTPPFVGEGDGTDIE